MSHSVASDATRSLVKSTQYNHAQSSESHAMDRSARECSTQGRRAGGSRCGAERDEPQSQLTAPSTTRGLNFSEQPRPFTWLVVHV